MGKRAIVINADADDFNQCGFLTLHLFGFVRFGSLEVWDSFEAVAIDEHHAQVLNSIRK